MTTMLVLQIHASKVAAAIPPFALDRNVIRRQVSAAARLLVQAILIAMIKILARQMPASMENAVIP